MKHIGTLLFSNMNRFFKRYYMEIKKRESNEGRLNIKSAFQIDMYFR